MTNLADPTEEIFDFLAIEEITSSSRLRKAYYRAKATSIKDLVLKKRRPDFPLEELFPLLEQFKETWNGIGSPDKSNIDPSTICAAVMAHKRCLSLEADPFPRPSERWHTSKAPKLLGDADLWSLAKKLRFSETKMPEINDKGDILGKIPLEMFPDLGQIQLYIEARNIYPLAAWEIQLWEKYCPTWALNQPIANQLFDDQLTRRIHNCASNHGWKTFRDFVGISHDDRWRVKNFGRKCLVALLLHMDALARQVPDRTSIDSFRKGPSILDFFRSELRRNGFLKKSWVETVRSCSGLEKKKMSHHSIARRLGVSSFSVMQYERLCWHRMLQNEPWRSLIRTRIQEIRDTAIYGRLTLQVAEEEEPWFLGISKNPECFSYIMKWVGGGDHLLGEDRGTYFIRPRT